MAQTMIFVTRGTINAQRFHELMGELNRASDRAVGILGGSLVEMSLTEALLAHLHRNKRITDELLKITGALGTFATKIHVGFLTGIYSHGAHKELSTIKDIRNRFAHSLEVKDFHTQQIRAWAMNLKFGERYTIDTNNPKAARMTPDKPFGEWDWWFSVKNRDLHLKNPRERFLISVQALTYALSVPLHCAMPRPQF